MFVKKCVCFFARRHFLSCGRRRSGCAAAKQKRAAAERPHMPTVTQPSVPAARESAARPNGIFRSRSRPQALSPHGNLLQKKGICCKNTAVFFGYPVPAAHGRIAAARTCLRSARGNMRGKEGKNHKRISTAFQPLRRPKAEQIRIAAESNRRLYTYPWLYNKRKVPKLSRLRRGKRTRTLCGSAISTKSRVLPCRRHGKIV